MSVSSAAPLASSVASSADSGLASAPPRGSCSTRRARHDVPSLLAALPTATSVVSFVVEGAGLLGWGRHASITVTGPDAAARIEHWYRQTCAALEVSDEVGVEGSGPVCFVSLGFGPRDPSVAVIPQVVLGRRDGVDFVTRIGDAAPRPTPAPVTAPGLVSYSDAEMSTTGFISAVESAIARIAAGEAKKVVLAHGLTAMTEFPVDERYLLTRLAERYPSCATFAVDGLVGASPEMLIRRHGLGVSSRVLAGTAWPERGAGAHGVTGGAASPHGSSEILSGTDDVAAHLLASPKDLAEHSYAVGSVADVLGPLTRTLHVPARPSALRLANLTHLATDISGELTGGDAVAPSALRLAAALHPTAAVGGTPSAVAQAMISELEPAPRGRYAAPVGWLDARGDGEFAIALRCALLDGTSVRMMAGCGIVADSDPLIEAREAQIKMVPVRDALEG